MAAPVDHSVSRCPPRARGSSLRGDESGFSLIELLVAMSMFAVVLIAVMTLWDTASNAGYNETERNTALAEDASGLDRMANDLRQAYQINGPATGQASDWVDLLVRTPSGTGAQADYRVIYDCTKVDPTVKTLHACYRYVSQLTAPIGVGGIQSSQLGKPSATATASLVIPRVINGTACSGSVTTDCIFTNFTNPQSSAYGPTTATITIRAASRGERQWSKFSNYSHDIVLNQSIYMRQLDFGR